MARVNHNWTEEEIEILKEHYLTEGVQAAKRLPRHPVTSCLNKARELGLSSHRARGQEWSEDEKDILRRYYPTERDEARKRLPNRSAAGCAVMASKLGILNGRQPEGTRKNRWTEEEVAILRQYFPTEGRKVADRLPDRTPVTCAHKARELGMMPERQKNNVPWTEEELDILRRWFPSEGLHVQKRLPRHTETACVVMARRLKLRRQNDLYWTEEEIEILRQFYPVEGVDAFVRVPRHSISACLHKASKLKIRAGKKKPMENAWSREEDDILCTYYPTENRAVAARLPKRSAGACCNRALKLGVAKVGTKLRWTREEDDILQKYYPMEGVKAAKRLPGRTERACMARAHLMGLGSTRRKSHCSIC